MQQRFQGIVAASLFLATPVLLLLSGLAAAEPCNQGAVPSVATDQTHYGPLETAVVTGEGYDCGATLTIRVTRPDGQVLKSGAAEEGSDTVVTDDAGRFTYDYDIQGISGEYFVDVLDAQGNVLASTSFFDSHSRYLQLSWKKRTGTTVDFTFVAGWRRNAYGSPVVGSVINVGERICFGDGACSAPLFFKVFSVDVPNNWIMTRALEPGSNTKESVSHTYASSTANYLASQASCCRIGRSVPNWHVNNPDGWWRAETIVNLAKDDASPTTLLPPIVDCAISAVCSFNVLGINQGNASGSLRYRLASAPEAAGGSNAFRQPGTAGSGSSRLAGIGSTSGVYTWDTTGATLAPSGSQALYSTQVMVEKVDGSGSVLSKSPIDFLIRLVSQASNAPPAFVSPTPASGTTFTVNAGSTLSFTVRAQDSDANTVSLSVLGLPAGASFPIPAAANPVESTFTWSPSAADAGNYVLVFTATDSVGASAPLLSIGVAVPAVTTDGEVASVALVNPPASALAGESTQLTVRTVIRNAGPEDSAHFTLTVTPEIPAGCTVSPAITSTTHTLAEGVDTTVDGVFTVTCADTGAHALVFRAKLAVQSPVGESDGADNEAKGSHVLNVVQDADGAIVSVTPTGPSGMQVGDARTFSVRTVARNLGPSDPAGFTVTTTPALPADCTATPASASSAVSIAVGTDEAVDASFDISCTDVRLSSLGFDSSIAVAAPLTDPEPANNDGSGALDVDVFSHADGEVVGVVVVDPPEEADVDAATTLTVRATARNHGPTSPADFTVTTTPSVPADCTVTPASATATVSLGSEATDVDAVFEVACAEHSFHDLAFDVALAPVAPVTDPDGSNDAGRGEATVAIIAHADLGVGAWTVSGGEDLVGKSLDLGSTAAFGSDGPWDDTDADVEREVTVPAGLDLTVTVGAGEASAVMTVEHADGTTETVDPAAAGEARTVKGPATIRVAFGLGGLGSGESRDVALAAKVTCTSPGTHTVTFGASVAPSALHVRDGNPADDAAERTAKVTCVMPVTINIKPGSNPNSINPNSNGNVPVAVLTTSKDEYGNPLAFEAKWVDAASVRFGPRSVLDDGKGAYDTDGKGSMEDTKELDEETKDGDKDMVLHFKTQQTGISSTTTEACVRGSYDSGDGVVRTFSGCDSVKIPNGGS